MTVELRPKVLVRCGAGCAGNDGAGSGGCCEAAAHGGLIWLGGLAEVFSQELAVHAPGVDAEEEDGEGDETKECGDRGEVVALAVIDDGGGGESRWEECGDGLDAVKDFEDEREMVRVVATVLEAGVVVDVDVLEGERGEENECGEDFAGAAGGEPAVDPDENHAGEEDVGECVGGKENRGPGEERRFRETDADVGGYEAEGADDGGGAKESEEDARGEVAREAEGEANDGVDVEAEAGRGNVEDDDLPESEDGPGEDGQKVEVAAGDEGVGCEAGTEDGADGDEGEQGKEDDAGDEFAYATFAAEGVAEDAPAEFR